MRLEHFILCQHATQDISGFYNLIGVIPANAINVQAPQGTPFYLPNFVCFVVFTDMVGITEVEFQCEVLQGDQVILASPRDTQRRTNVQATTHTQAFGFFPFALPGAGDYTMKVTTAVQGRITSYSRRLSVTRSDPSSTH